MILTTEVVKVYTFLMWLLQTTSFPLATCLSEFDYEKNVYDITLTENFRILNYVYYDPQCKKKKILKIKVYKQKLEYKM